MRKVLFENSKSSVKFEFGCHGNKVKFGTFFKVNIFALISIKIDSLDFRGFKTVGILLICLLVAEICLFKVGILGFSIDP